MPASQRSNDLSGNRRVKAAAAKACEAHSSVTRAARKLAEELDEITNTNLHAVPVELDPEDSVVIAVSRVITAHRGTNGL